jgi:hypothetical protein
VAGHHDGEGVGGPIAIRLTRKLINMFINNRLKLMNLGIMKLWLLS